MISLSKMKKVRNYVGITNPQLPALFLNSMPKAGTNLLEQTLINLGYLRSFSRCLNETNIGKKKIRPSMGRFYVGHLPVDDPMMAIDIDSVFLLRPIAECMFSYCNYMLIDHRHPVSEFVLSAPRLATFERLFFSSDNPNGRPLVDEYMRFSQVDLSRYKVVTSFQNVQEKSDALLMALSDLSGVPEGRVADCIDKAAQFESFTKNQGRVSVFELIGECEMIGLKAEIESLTRTARSDTGRNF